MLLNGSLVRHWRTCMVMRVDWMILLSLLRWSTVIIIICWWLVLRRITISIGVFRRGALICVALVVLVVAFAGRAGIEITPQSWISADERTGRVANLEVTKATCQHRRLERTTAVVITGNQAITVWLILLLRSLGQLSRAKLAIVVFGGDATASSSFSGCSGSSIAVLREQQRSDKDQRGRSCSRYHCFSCDVRRWLAMFQSTKGKGE